MLTSPTARTAFHGLVGDMLVRARDIETDVVDGETPHAEIGALLTDVLRLVHLNATGELPAEMERLSHDTTPPRLTLAEARQALLDAGCIVVDPAPARLAAWDATPTLDALRRMPAERKLPAPLSRALEAAAFDAVAAANRSDLAALVAG